MPTVARLQDAKNEVVPVVLGAETLNITVAMGRITSAWSDDFAAAAEAEDNAKVVDMFVEVVLDWDLFERDPEDGEDPASVPRVPITAESMMVLPTLLWAELGEALKAKMSPGEGNAAGSFGG